MNDKYYSTLEYRDKIYKDLHLTTRDNIILMCAIFIASVGLNMNSTAVIIGAMLISPLMTPIVALGMGFALYDTKLIYMALKSLCDMVFVSLLVSSLYFWLSPINYASSELLARINPTIWDVIIAIAGGIAGVIGSRKKESNNIVPGVAIATALMPPICTAGYGIAHLNSNFFFGAIYLFVINAVFIMITTFIGSRIMMRKSLTQNLKNTDRKVRTIILAIVVILIIPSVFSAGYLVNDYVISDSINHFVDNEFSNQAIISRNYNKDKKILELTTVGEYMDKDELKALDEKKNSYGLSKVEIKIHQVKNNDAENQMDLYKNLEQYIENKMNSKINNKDILRDQNKVEKEEKDIKDDEKSEKENN